MILDFKTARNLSSQRNDQDKDYRASHGGQRTRLVLTLFSSQSLDGTPRSTVLYYVERRDEAIFYSTTE